MIYRLGSKGDGVRQIQARLDKTGYASLVGEVDGDYGPKTAYAVRKFQQDHGLNADGIVGGLTWRALFGPPMPLTFPHQQPIMQRDLLERFGSPLESSFGSTYIVWIDLSEFHYALVKRFQTLKGYGCWGHYLAVKPLKLALKNLAAAGGDTLLGTFDGSWVVRNTRGSNNLSTHAFGFAFDFNAASNPLNGACKMPLEVVWAFAQAGFEWGGLWKNPVDCMHFQLAWTRDWRESAEDLAPAVPQW